MSRKSSRDTRYSLVQFTGSQEDAERLSGQILSSEGYESVDPTHPLGGRDGKKDLKCTKDGVTFVAGCYFPRGQQSFTQIKKKFLGDVKGVSENKAAGFIFISNQEIKDAERNELKGLTHYPVDIYHLDRIIHILNEPKNFYTRQQYLDIEMTKEEMLSAFLSIQSENKKEIRQLQENIERLEKAYSHASVEKSINRAQSKDTEKQVKDGGKTFRQGEMYFADLGNDLENVVKGFRPVVIISNDINNTNSTNLTVVPVSSHIRRNKLPTHVDIGRAMGLDRECIALADQILTINKKKLIARIAMLDQTTTNRLISAIKVQIAPYVRNENGYIKVLRKDVED